VQQQVVVAEREAVEAEPAAGHIDVAKAHDDRVHDREDSDGADDDQGRRGEDPAHPGQASLVDVGAAHQLGLGHDLVSGVR
jgi:hypothetical protein